MDLKEISWQAMDLFHLVQGYEKQAGSCEHCSVTLCKM
jgi:hypothetical protein